MCHPVNLQVMHCIVLHSQQRHAKLGLGLVLERSLSAH